MAEDKLREQLAELAHDLWAGWTLYFFEHLHDKTSGREPNIDRWKRQARTPYRCLPEHEKDSDRREADRMLAIFRAVKEAVDDKRGNL